MVWINSYMLLRNVNLNSDVFPCAVFSSERCRNQIQLKIQPANLVLF